MQRFAFLRRASLAACSLCLATSCQADTVDEVSKDVCASGRRWVGDLTPSEEMYPGQDCVGCHKAYDGPELLAGGTIYGLPDPEGALTTKPDCFGIEGVKVMIRAADGQVLETRTNRAGNFYFEGREASLAKPFRVTVEYDFPDGRQSRQPMSSQPSYGGCARCHRPDVTPTPGAVPGSVLQPDDVVEGVFPIYTGPVLE